MLICDIFIIVGAVNVWYTSSSDLPRSPRRPCASSAQQWAWTFVHPGPDGKIDTADDKICGIGHGLMGPHLHRDARAARRLDGAAGHARCAAASGSHHGGADRRGGVGMAESIPTAGPLTGTTITITSEQSFWSTTSSPPITR